jgi:hypothetical protein
MIESAGRLARKIGVTMVASVYLMGEIGAVLSPDDGKRYSSKDGEERG